MYETNSQGVYIIFLITPGFAWENIISLKVAWQETCSAFPVL